MNARLSPSIFTVAMLALGCAQLSCSHPPGGSKASSVEQSRSTDPDIEVPTIEFCDVLRKPFLYEAKTIKIKARLSRYREYITFYDKGCVPGHPLVGVVFDPSFQYETVSEAGRNLNQIIRGSEDAGEGNISVFVAAVGFFKEIPSNQRADYTELQYQFIVGKVTEIDTLKQDTN
ncbi:MAG TPA: hypothetical protein VF527_14725 [Pyrinomonadaceae bacterium]|jgi:hypothetical protein